MLVSYRWLARHVDLTGVSPEDLAELLTLSTAEVEGIEPFAPHLSAVRVGLVETRVKHPDADKLGICTVRVDGNEDAERLQIVCGAPNVGAGQRVAVATVGTRLPGDLKIKKSKIRGVESRGMICSERELELGEDHSGIWVLPESCEIGQPVAAALGLDDWVLEIDNKSLTHRPDCWGHRGLAREIAAILKRDLRPLDLPVLATGSGSSYPVRIDTPDCPRYMALEIEGAKVLPSPVWLRFLLLAVGQRPMDQLVDLSNFVMLDLGQPTHVFDRGSLSSEGISVRHARDAETLTTLDGEQRKLQESDLLICSGDKPVALAGVMGEEGSKVTDDSSGLLLEVANFAPVVVRRTAMRLGLRTDASARFEKSLDPNLPLEAMTSFAAQLQALQPDVSFPSTPTDTGDWQDPSLSIQLRPARARALLGADVSDGEIQSILTRLGFEVAAQGESFAVQVPAWRATKDITIEEDLIEEVGRIYRYDRIPEQSLHGAITPPPRDARREMVKRIQDRLAGAARFHEVLTYSFHSDRLIELFGLGKQPHVGLVNPVSEGEGRMRRSVLPSVVSLLENNRRRYGDVRLFEVGKGYQPEQANERGEPHQVHQVALAWATPPAGKKAPFDAARFGHMQGVLDDLLGSLGLAPHCWGELDSVPTWAHPHKHLAAHFAGLDEPAVILAELEPGLARRLGLTGELASDVAVAEISIDRLIDAPGSEGGYRPIPRFPGIKVDVAVLLADTRPAGEVVEAIRKAGKGAVAEIELFDLYRSDSLGTGKKSLAYHVLLQSEQKTLTDQDGQKFLSRLERQLQALDAELRKG
ncbi:MAG: phenylalanyl-tRNA synthetase beta chain [Chlamydiales bacterium]|jgi:phenylalanyl-tRNA synthetase beta chain